MIKKCKYYKKYLFAESGFGCLKDICFINHSKCKGDNFLKCEVYKKRESEKEQ